MPIYRGELKDGKGRWLHTVCIKAEDEAFAAKALGITSSSFSENFTVLEGDHRAERACDQSVCNMGEGTVGISMRPSGVEKYLDWLPVSDYRELVRRSIEKANEVESWG